MTESSKPNYLVRVLKGRDYKPPEKAESQPEPAKPEFEMPDDGSTPEVESTAAEVSELDDLIPPDVNHNAAPVSVPVEPSAEERASQQAEAEKIEAERQAEIEAERKAREERAAAKEAKRKKNAAIRAKRLRRIEESLPKPLAFVSVSSAIQTRLSSLALVAKSGREADVRRLVSAYESAGFVLMDLRPVMADHFEIEAREWSCVDTIDAWLQCDRADWLAWACSGAAGWGYPGLWPAASDCVRQALAVSVAKVPKEVSSFLSGIVKDLDVFMSSWRREAPDLDLLDDLKQSTRKLVENIASRGDHKLAVALKAAEAVQALVSLDPADRPPVDAVVRAAATLAAVAPERSSMPADWLPDDPERSMKWEAEGRPRAEIKAKLSFLAPIVKKRIPVPVAV